MSKQARMTLRRANTLPSNSLLSSISSWGDGVMAPPPLPLRPYVPTHPTDFNPLDLLEGTMDLAVTLPSGKKVVMNVYRSTPMMDLMVQVTTAHHINPGGHVIQVISDNLSLSYKPSTPIGTLDTNAIKVVAKNKINEMAQRRKLNLHQEAVERNIRLKPKEWVFKQQLVVNLPHNQLAVYRVPPKALISDIFAMICEDKNLDCESHEMRHPVNLDERLRGSCSLSDYQLRELCVVSSDFRPPPLSVTDLITMSSIAHPEDKKRRSFLGLFSRKAKSSTGDSSVSSGSAGERSVSPARSDDSAESHPTPQPLSAASSSGTLTNVNSSSGPVRNEAPCRTSVSLHNSMTSIHSPPARMSRPVSMISLNRSRKRPAPIPPQVEGGLRGQEDQSQYRDALKIQINGKVNSGKEKQSLSRHSSDSSGYHESNVKSSQTSPSGSEVGPLEAPKKPLPSSNLSATASGSILSISSVSKGKRKAPSPPKAPMNGEGPCAIPESPEEVESREGTRSCEVEEEVGVSRNVEEKSENKGPSYQEEREAGATTTSPHFEKHLETKQPHPPSTETCSVVTDFSHDHNSSTSTTTALPTSLRDTPDNTSSPTLPDIAHNDTPSIAPAVDPYVVHPSSFQVGGGDQPPSCPSQISSENDTHPDVESLSLETTDVEMLNPKDIQRPKRQKRKRIPEEFLKKSPQNDSSGSSCEKSLERINHDKTSDGNLALESSNAEQNREKSNHLPNHNSDEVSEDKMISLQSASENGDLEGSVNEACNGDVATPLSHPSVLYVEMISEEETSTDPVPPVRASKQSYTSKVQLSLNTQTQNPVNHDSTGSRPAISISRLTSSESSSFPTEEVKTEISKVDVIAELKSAIEASSDEDHPPRILNFKPKGKDWNDAAQTTSDYNVILSFGNSDSSTRVGPVREASMTSSSSGEGKSVTRSSSSTSYESIDNSCHVSSEVSKANSATTVRDSRSNTESSYESAPPPLPESRIPVISDSSSKTSSATVSRQSSFSDYDSQSSPPEFVKPRAPAFSISTYQSRASKVSYDKKLSRSESLSSVKDLHGQGTGDCHRRKGVVDEEKASEGGSPSRRLCRSGSQRNEIFRSDDIRKKSTSTTFLNSPVGEWNEIKSTNGPIRPSFVKSQSRSSLLESGANDASKTNQHGCVQFELSSAKDSVIFPRPFGKPLPQLRKTRSTFDIRAPEGKISEGYQTIPDSGLANEYIRLQDDFMKWQNQLLQNQQILHNRVAPIAANPPTLNSVGMVSNMMNQMPTDAPAQKRKPIEISIPIRLEDSDDDDREPLRQTQPTRRVREPVQPTKGPQGNHPETESNLWTKGPSVPIGAWQERPMPPRGDATERMRPQASDMPRPFGQPSGMVTFAPQAAPQGRCPPSPPQQMSQGFHQQMPHSGYQQMPQSGYQQMPQSGYQQMPQSGYQQMPQSNYQQMPQSNYQQMPQSGYQQVPQTSFQQSSSQPGTRNQPVLYDPREEVFHNGDEGINARFSSVVTLNKDKDDQNSALAKDKVRSVVQLNNTAEPAPQARSGAPFHSRIISASSREPDMEEVRRSPSGNPPAGGFAGTPMSSRLVQQAVQQPLGRSNVSPPKMERLPSPPQVMRRPSPPKMERHPSPPKEPSPEPQPSPPPFAGVKLRPVESRVSPPKTVIPQPPLPSDVFGPPPPPPPPSKVPQAPPPPPGMPEDRRTSTGKKIISSTNAPQLDARQELMMAIRQFGGSSNLKRSVYPPPGVPKSS